MRILGIDPGSVATGFGVVEYEDGNLVHLGHGTIRLPRKADMPERLAFLQRAMTDMLRSHEPEIAAVEQVFVARNPQSAMVLGQARGAALAALGAAGLSVREYAARAVKQSVVGKGSAAKPQVQAMVARFLGLGSLPQSDAADALAVAICHAHSGRLIELGAGRRPRSRSLREVARHLT